MKKFSKIIACLSALSMCVSMGSFADISAFAVNSDYTYEDFINDIISGNADGLGDVNFDGVIDSIDASLVLSHYSQVSTGGNNVLPEEQQKVADVNKDGFVNSIDAREILNVYTYASSYDSPIRFDYPNERLTPNGNFSDKEISESAIKPTIDIDIITLSLEEAQAISAMGEPVSIDIYVSGADGAYSSTGIHVNYPEIEKDMKLSIADVDTGEAIEYLYPKISYDNSSAFLATSGSSNNGFDGVMYTLKFTLPDNIRGGEYFPITIDFQDGDLFTNNSNNETGQLMQAYLFTQGIANGAIIIEASGPMPIPTKTTVTTSTPVVNGDANGDDEINVADAVLIMQSLSNPNEYKLTEQQKANADVVNHGDGVTAMDALAIQLIGLNMVKAEDFPITTEQLNEITKN